MRIASATRLSLALPLVLLLALCLGTARPVRAQAAPAASAPAPVPQPPIAVGEQAPTFHLTSSDGMEFSLHDLEGRKNLVLLFFRGTW